jgi:AraC-like DNA-binding protein
MKPVLRKITASASNSFIVRKDTGQYMINDWHYHPEVEILLIKKSAGTWLVGDHTGHFQRGDVVLIGENLPHCFRHDACYTSNKATAGETICVKFLPEIFGEAFLQLPETRQIKELLGKSACGLQLTGRLKETIAAMIEKMPGLSPGNKLVHLLAVLEEIAERKKYLALSSKGFMQSPGGDTDREKIKLVFDYTFRHYTEKITIEMVAALLNMTRQSFCRYFKNKTKKNYIRFLMEVRVGAACRLLVEDEKNVAEISYDCGYNNISHFNHQFKAITGKKPLAYRKDYLESSDSSAG